MPDAVASVNIRCGEKPPCFTSWKGATMKANRLNARQRFLLTKEIDVFESSPRKLTLTAAEFTKEMERELGFTITYSNLEGAARQLGFSLSDLFTRTNGGRSIYAEVKVLSDRVSALETRLEGL